MNAFQGNLVSESLYNISIVDGSAQFVSALSLLITDDLNGTTVTCEGAANQQVTVITILGS